MPVRGTRRRASALGASKSLAIGERICRIRLLVSDKLVVTCVTAGTLFIVEWLPG